MTSPTCAVRASTSGAAYREFHFGVTRGEHVQRGAVSYLRAEVPLAAYPRTHDGSFAALGANYA